MLSPALKPRAYLLACAAALLLLALAFALQAPGAHAATKWKKCSDTLKVKKISCDKAQQQVVGEIIAAWFGNDSSLKYGKGCGKRDKVGNVCEFTVEKWDCIGKTKAEVWAVSCAKKKKRVKADISRFMG